jgi:serine phosphatase RsbU (regulator of sigma subunit)
METLTESMLDLGIATLTRAGEAESGDLYLLLPFAGGALIAVVDCVGHGAETAQAARTAVDILKSRPHEPVELLIKYCHEGLRASRGVVMSLASLDVLEGRVTWAGVGNVEGRFLPADSTLDPQTLLLSVGTVGHRLTPVYPAVIPVHPGDTLIFATDGVRDGFSQWVTRSQSPQRIADDILRREARHTDDALVLVARYSGAAS